MMMAQIPPDILALFFNNPSTRSTNSPKKLKSNLMKLHWEKIDEVPEESVWANVQGQFSTEESKGQVISLV